MTRALRTYILTLLALSALCIGPRPCGAGQDIVLGMSAAFSGPIRELGIELHRGAQAYFDQVNQRGGVHGNTISILALDDAYNPQKCLDNTITLIQRSKVFALFNYVGTPTTTKILPLLKRYGDRNMLMLFPLTGAEPLRRHPYVEKIFNLRASYNDEALALVDNFLAAGRDDIAVFYQADAFGRNGWDGVRRALASQHKTMAVEATYHRGTAYEDDMTPQIEIIQRKKPQAVICVGTSAACAAFIRDANTLGLQVPIATMSFADPETTLDLLEKEPSFPAERLGDIITSAVVPCHEHHELPAVQEFMALMEQTTSVPTGLIKGPYSPPAFSPVAFEGFLNAKALVLALERIGPNPSRKALAKALNDPSGYDLGLGTPVVFSPDRHQAMDKIYFIGFDKGRLVPIHDFGRWSQ
ncbi:ABC transporter substrate-binding protein [Desulfovibrio ferrophilus]|uniref:Leucine-binding protein domain-containing protein n=1 Tax=Desulfovibrio ferrophilus TaxID=241368 RepID=A0A2Z6B0N2_9BACT|nr:ABC transporter substrate-binding protein [Desulfovibrio ferrophilus]BBD09061.1 uncharacterized protein DFE_2335 [Desulfovibrio ferrophilus]